MRRSPPEGIADYAPLAFPAAMLIIFFVVPFSTMIAVSFFRRDPSAFYTPDFVFDNYARFLTGFFGGVLGFSLVLAVLVALCCVVIAFPFTYLLTRQSRRVQTVWLVGLLSVLSLSEVIIGFAWSTLLSRTAGLTNLLVAAGLMAEPQALLPGFGAVLTGMVYQALPYTVLVLYPALVRFEPTLLEAARTLGASPVRAFLNVVVPALRNTIVATLIMVFVFALGSMTGKAQLPPLRVVTRDHIVGIASTSTRTLHIKQTLIWVRMADGSELRLETAQRHWRHGDELVEELLGSGVAAMETPPAFRPSQKPK